MWKTVEIYYRNVRLVTSAGGTEGRDEEKRNEHPEPIPRRVSASYLLLLWAGDLCLFSRSRRVGRSRLGIGDHRGIGVRFCGGVRPLCLVSSSLSSKINRKLGNGMQLAQIAVESNLRTIVYFASQSRSKRPHFADTSLIAIGSMRGLVPAPLPFFFLVK